MRSGSHVRDEIHDRCFVSRQETKGGEDQKRYGSTENGDLSCCTFGFGASCRNGGSLRDNARRPTRTHAMTNRLITIAGSALLLSSCAKTVTTSSVPVTASSSKAAVSTSVS